MFYSGFTKTVGVLLLLTLADVETSTFCIIQTLPRPPHRKSLLGFVAGPCKLPSHVLLWLAVGRCPCRWSFGVVAEVVDVDGGGGSGDDGKS